MPQRNLPTLADCGCKAIVYGDGSGVDLEYCSLHQAAPDLLDACKAALAYLRTPGYPPELGDQIRAAIAMAQGRQTNA